MIFHPSIKTLADSEIPFWSESDVLLEGIRFNRNFAPFVFPNAATSAERIAVCDLARRIFRADDVKMLLPPLFEIPFKEMTDIDKEVLMERNLLGTYWSEFSPDAYLLCAVDGSFSATINGLDHLELRMNSSGKFSIEQLRQKMEKLDDAISSHVQYMFHERYGYLTSLSNDAGTGMHCFCLLHLPLLSLLGEFRKKSNVIEMLGFSSAPYYTNNKQQHGNLFWIGNLSTLGEKEVDLTTRMTEIKNWLLSEERYIRQDVFQSQPELLLNPCGRSYGLLKYAQILAREEVLDALSMLKLGVDCHIFNHITAADILKFRTDTLPGHMQTVSNHTMSKVEQYHVYADYMRKSLCGPDYSMNYYRT